MDRVRTLEEPSGPAAATSVFVGHMLMQAGFDSAAFRWFEHGEPALPKNARRSMLHLRTQLAQRLGRTAEARTLARHLVLTAEGAEALASGAEELISLGAFGDATAVLEDAVTRHPASVQVRRLLARLCAWSGDLPRLDALIKDLPPEPATQKLRAIWLACHERYEEALQLFEEIVEHIDTEECRLWLAELHLRVGHPPKRAHYELERSRLRSQNAAHLMLAVWIDDANWGPKLLSWYDYLDGTPPRPTEEKDLERSRVFCREALRWFRGNRTDRLTRVLPAKSTSPRHLTYVEPPEDDSVLSSRNASANAVRSVATRPVAEAQQTLMELAERYPTSPHPLCYGGELKLWLGDLDGAFADFDTAMARGKTRWAYVGRAAVHSLRGELEAAISEFTQCARNHEAVLGATTHVYRGELFRRNGDHRRAIEDLRSAVDSKPGRVAAWMNLALSLDATGESAEAGAIFDRLNAWVPGLMWDVRASLDPELPWPLPPDAMRGLFEHALVMMRGNRSSHLVTYFTADGAFRVTQDAQQWAERVKKHDALILHVLTERLNRAERW
jgi:hypothetical protein